MKVLIIGNGSREHAIAWKLSNSPLVDKIYVAPGNAGTAAIGVNLPIAASDIQDLAQAAKYHEIDVTIVGPEIPLEAGIIDLFHNEGMAAFGPKQEAARIESSKVFAKNLMLKHQIPTAHAKVFDSYNEACGYIESIQPPLVVKADGLAAGKGVTVATTQESALNAAKECMVDRIFGPAGDMILIEECLTGQEVSVFAFTDGKSISPLIAACDYKRAYDNDLGPNTGGMGSYSPPTFWNPKLEREIRDTIVEPTIAALQKEGIEYTGVLYSGIMLTRNGPKVIEFNCRLGDPEAQVILPRLSTDLMEIILAVTNRNLHETTIEWQEMATVGVVMASGGYPGKYTTGIPIKGLTEAEEIGLVFHAGSRNGRQAIITDGGRVLTLVGRGYSLDEARVHAYASVSKIEFQGAFYRHDIATDKQKQ